MYINGGVVSWKEHFNQKREKEVEFMDLDKEWKLEQVEQLLSPEEEKVENV